MFVCDSVRGEASFSYSFIGRYVCDSSQNSSATFAIVLCSRVRNISTKVLILQAFMCGYISVNAKVDSSLCACIYSDRRPVNK